MAKWSVGKNVHGKNVHIFIQGDEKTPEAYGHQQPGMGKCLAAGSSEMQPLFCWKFIQIKALMMMMALANEWIAEYKGVSDNVSLFPVRYWEHREDIFVTWCNCTSLPKYSHKHKKPFELSMFQPVQLSFEVSLSFSSEFFISLPYTYTQISTFPSFFLQPGNVKPLVHPCKMGSCCRHDTCM